MAWKKTSTSRGVGAAPTLTSLASSRPIAARSGAKSFGSATSRTACSSVRDRLARPARARPAACRRRAASARLLVAAELGLHAGLELLPHARDGEEPRRLDRGQVGADLARVRAGRDRHRVDDREVVVGGALGDVGARQPRDHARAVREADALLDGVDRRHLVAVGDLDALGRPGRAARVDQREDVVGLDGAPVRLGVELRVLGPVAEGQDVLDEPGHQRQRTAPRRSPPWRRRPRRRSGPGRARRSGRSRTASRRASSPPGRRS